MSALQPKPFQAVMLMAFCTLFTSLGQILWKVGLKDIILTQPQTLLNFFFILGFFSYGIGALLMILAFQRAELSIVYPIAATSYIWVSLVSPFLFPADSMNPLKWLGVFLILISVSLLGWGSSKNQKPSIPPSTMPSGDDHG